MRAPAFICAPDGARFLGKVGIMIIDYKINIAYNVLKEIKVRIMANKRYTKVRIMANG